MTISLDRFNRVIKNQRTMQVSGKVTKVIGLLIEGHCPGVSIGSLCRIGVGLTRDYVLAEVVGFRDDKVLLMPLGGLSGITPGGTITLVDDQPKVQVGEAMLGRVLDGMLRPLDGKGPLDLHHEVPLYAKPLNPMQRSRIEEPLDLGIRALNGMLTCGKGQRLGIMAGSGVGKSVLLGMIARYTSAAVNVIALIGERGRELREFIERDLGEEGLKRSVVVVVTSDQSALLRSRGALVATAVAEYFRAQGQDVLLMMDSLTRFCMAHREIGLSAGEPPTTKGYPPSVFNILPRLLERAGTSRGQGSITGLYTVLVEGDDMNEPVADAARSILDGHIVLSRRLAHLGHYPAIDVLQSASRVMMDIVPPEHLELTLKLREILAVYSEAEEMINIGAYVKGKNKRIDYAIQRIDALNAFLRQRMGESANMVQTFEAMRTVP